MSGKKLSARFLAELNMELSLMLHAGFTVTEALETMRGDSSSGVAVLLGTLFEETEAGIPLSSAMEKTGRFPVYMTDMVRLGEVSGRLEETLSSLAEDYDRREQMASGLRGAVTYPAVLLLMLGAVVIVLVTRVLPIFNDVFMQLGIQMSSFALALMHFGQGLASASTGIVCALVTILLFVFIFGVFPPIRRFFSAFFRKIFGGRGIYGHISTAHFASAMATALSSGLELERAVELAGCVVRGAGKLDLQVKSCLALVRGGQSLEQGLIQSGLFSGRDGRLLALGARTGSADTVMAEIARRNTSRAMESLETFLNGIEPALVIVISVIVASVLLSVMLPLMGIMSTIA